MTDAWKEWMRSHYWHCLNVAAQLEGPARDEWYHEAAATYLFPERR